MSKNIYTLRLKQSPSAAASTKQMCLQKTLKRDNLTRRRDAGNMFHSREAATANDLLPSHVLVSGTTHVNLPDDHSRRLMSGTGWHLSDKYGGAVPCSDLNMKVFILKSTRRRTGSQCNSLRMGVMCSRRPVRVINLAAAFCVFWTERSLVTLLSTCMLTVKCKLERKFVHCDLIRRKDLQQICTKYSPQEATLE